jgi:hypothetical protein
MSKVAPKEPRGYAVALVTEPAKPPVPPAETVPPPPPEPAFAAKNVYCNGRFNGYTATLVV